jgi:transposase
MMGTAITALTVGLAVGGYAAEAAPDQAAMEAKVASAKSRADHEALAAWYEQEAKATKEQVERHRRMLERYKIAPYAEYYKRTHSSAGFIQQCKHLIQQSEQATEANLALADLHRRMAADVKE